MPANGTSTSPSAPKTSRPNNPNKPPKQVKPSKQKDAQAHQSSTIAATTVKVASQNVGSNSKAKDKDASSKDGKDGNGGAGAGGVANGNGNGNGGKGKNKRTADVMSLFTEKELSGGTIKLKPVVGKDGSRKKPRTANQGNWKERAGELEKQDETYHKALQASQANPSIPPPGGKSPGPILTPLDDKDLAALSATNRPPHDEPEHVVCKHCKKPVIKVAAVQHIKACLRLKTEKAKERKKAKEAAAAAAAALAATSKGEEADEAKDETAGGEASAEGGGSGKGGKSLPGEAVNGAGKGGVMKKGAKKMAAKKATGEPKKTKKQRLLEEKLAKEAKPKKKKEKPAKPEPKPKAPVDVEKQCGVPLPNGLLCARSLTCKSHSMGAKRAVMGRSQPYDVLLGAYQRKNQAKQQKLAINASGPHPDEPDGPLGPVDSDEETELVMAAVARVCPMPMVTQTFVPVRKKYQYLRMRDMLGAALRPGGGAGGGLYGGGGMNMGMGGNSGAEPMEGVQNVMGMMRGDGDVVMGGMGMGGIQSVGMNGSMGGQPMMRGGGGSSRGGAGGGGLFSTIGSSQGRGASVSA